MVYVDDYNAKFGRMIMCHMVADTLEELHAMADKIGMKRHWFQDGGGWFHYDVSLAKKRLAITHGAVPVTSRELIVKIQEIRQKLLDAPVTQWVHGMSKLSHDIEKTASRECHGYFWLDQSKTDLVWIPSWDSIKHLKVEDLPTP